MPRYRCKGANLLLHLARFEIHIQCRLVPKREELLIVGPALALWRKLQVEVGNDAGKYEAQLDERKTEQASQHRKSRASLTYERGAEEKEILLHPNAVPWSVREALENFLVVIVEATVVHPAIRNQRVWVEEGLQVKCQSGMIEVRGRCHILDSHQPSCDPQRPLNRPPALFVGKPPELPDVRAASPR